MFGCPICLDTSCMYGTHICLDALTLCLDAPLFGWPPVCLDIPICLDTLLYVLMPAYVWTPPIFECLPVCLGTPYVWMLPYIWMHPLYVWMSSYIWVTPCIFGCPQYVWILTVSLSTPMFRCPLVCLEDVWMPAVHIQQKESMLCQTEGCPYAPIHLDAPCMFGHPHMF